MDDDIDIEEHDLLDNPALKDIFPDLSVIKREIFDNFEGVVKKETFHSEPDAELTGLSTNPSITSENIRIDQNRLRLSSVETKNEISSNETEVMQCSVIIPKPCYNDNVTICFDKIVKSPLKSNRIILGSRPQVTLLLEDVRPYLIRSKRFCKTCSTLFSDATNLSKHIANLHSNKCLQEDNSKGAYKCKKCNREYVYEIELKKHISRNHNTYINSVSSTKKIECVKEKNKISGEGTSEKVNLEHQCVKCGNKYTQKKNLIRHIKSKHDKNSDLRNRNATKKDPKKCNVCNITCATDLILKQHIQTHENLVEETVTSTNSSNRNETHAVEELDSKEIISKCFHCKKVFGDQKKFIDHLYEILQDQKYSKIEEKHEEDMGEDNVNKIDKSRGIEKEYIRCPKCFYYFKYIQVYVAHMIKKHNMKNVPVVKFVSYEDNCFFCGEELATWKQYNKHMHQVHSDQLNIDDRQSINEELQENTKSDLLACKVCCKTYEDPELLSNHYIMKHTDSLKKNINLNISVFDNSEDYNDSSFFLSILFKCNKCDIHFMFAKCATNHVEHMDMLINWKCPSCLRIFKKKDEILHTKQHMFYENDFTVYDLCETELSRILFNCPKCAVHFNEESFLCHFQKCGSQIRNSNYCKVCDILIDSDSISSHDESHKSLNDKRNNFIFVETNIKLGKNVKRNDRKIEIGNAVGGRLEDTQSETTKIKVFYCDHCKSNLTEFGSKARCHVEKKCDRIPKYICKHCGLLVTARGQLSHVKVHSNGRTFKLQDALFFDLNGKQIKPPMPDFPKCVGCGMQFIRKQFIYSHICTDKNFVICKVCQGKFSDAAYKLHNDFHNYSLSVGSESISSEDLVSHSPVENEILIPEVPKKDLIVKVPKLPLPNVLATDQYFIYICNLCRIAFDFYDRVVEHCQAHFLKETYKYFPTKYCEECDLEYDTQCYERHSQTHSRGEFDKDNTKYLNFDLDFFLQENRIWLKHVYDGFPGKERSRYVAESIYRYEAKVKLSILQAGPFNLTVYKCAKCNCFVDRGSLFKHAKNSCFSQRNHPCRFCGLPFISFNSKEEHEKIHSNKDINIKSDSYRIVIFNREEDKNVNEAISERKKYVLYQCRNCDIVVNVQKYADHVCDQKSVSKCKECGLLFQSQDYNLHSLKHQECNDYYPRNIKMLLCGQKKQNGEKRTQPPTFRGVVHDYTFYQCSECQACMKDCQSNRHDCDLKYKCDYCELFFVNKQHSKLHNNDPDFVKSNINLIALKSRPNKHKIEDIEKDDNSSSKSNIESDSSKINSASKIKQILVYKCPCDLHFFETSLLSSHLSGTSCGTKVKNVGQKCSKCELVFTPKTLFSHVLKHHGNKTVTHKFKIIECCKKENTLYKCCKCALHFPTYGDAYEHCESCKNTNEGKQCKVCERYITSTHIKEHEQLHVTNPTDDDFLIHEVVFNESEPAVEDDTKNSSTISECISLSKQHLLKLDLSKYSNVLFKCKDCNFIALDRVTLVCHLLSNTHDVQNLEVCTHCQYSFPMASLITHVYVHHNKWKLLRRDLIIQESSVQW